MQSEKLATKSASRSALMRDAWSPTWNMLEEVNKMSPGATVVTKLSTVLYSRRHKNSLGLVAFQSQLNWLPFHNSSWFGRTECTPRSLSRILPCVAAQRSSHKLHTAYSSVGYLPSSLRNISWIKCTHSLFLLPAGLLRLYTDWKHTRSDFHVHSASPPQLPLTLLSAC